MIDLSNLKMDNLKKQVEFLQRNDPYSNKYAGFSTSLNVIERILNKLEKKILKEVEKYE